MADMKVFSGTNSRYVALKIAKELGVELGKINIQRFADGEFEVSYEEPVRGAEVYLIQSTFKASENLMELLLMIDAAKRASAQSVIAVIPYFGWARQDRKDKPRVSIAAKLVANILIASGIDRLITMTCMPTRSKASLTSPWTTCMPQPCLFLTLLRSTSRTW